MPLLCCAPRRGTDLELPFRCPLDFLVPIPSLDHSGLQYRLPGFLQLPAVPPALRDSQAAVVIAPARPADPFPPPAKLAGQAAMVWPGIKQGELLRAVEPLAEAAVLNLRQGPPLHAGQLGCHSCRCQLQPARPRPAAC